VSSPTTGEEPDVEAMLLGVDREHLEAIAHALWT
jgi:hypothetical protein